MTADARKPKSHKAKCEHVPENGFLLTICRKCGAGAMSQHVCSKCGVRYCSECGGYNWYDLTATEYLMCLDCGHQEPM